MLFKRLLFPIFIYSLTLILAPACDKGQDAEPTPVPPVPVTTQGPPADCRWQLTEAYYGNESGEWLSCGKCRATAGEGRGTAWIEAEAAPGTQLEYGTNSGLSVTGLQEDACLLFCIPVDSLERGTDVDFLVTIGITGANGPSKWIFEYKDGGEWKSGRSFRTVYGESNHTSFVEHFTMETGLRLDTLMMRCRVTEGGSVNGTVFLAPFNYESCHIFTYPESRFPKTEDTKKVLALGNSFSYYRAPVWMLKEIARSQGHQIDLRMNVKGSQKFSNHLELELSKDAVGEGSYDVALIQDQSTMHSNYYNNPSSASSKNTLDDTKELAGNILKASPGCRVILENTWSYATSDFAGFGSYAEFDTALRGGSDAIAREAGVELSPINKAFEAARKAGFTLYYTDDKHQNEYGAYLKACVNYLMIYGGSFSPDASDCNLPEKAAVELRSIAQDTVNS